MVSEKVEIFTKSYKEDAQAVRWECDGSPEYTLKKPKKKTRGTDIVLHINEESKEFLEAIRIKVILEKFCRFLPVPIFFEGASRSIILILHGQKNLRNLPQKIIRIFTKNFILIMNRLCSGFI